MKKITAKSYEIQRLIELVSDTTALAILYDFLSTRHNPGDVQDARTLRLQIEEAIDKKQKEPAL